MKLVKMFLNIVVAKTIDNVAEFVNSAATYLDIKKEAHLVCDKIEYQGFKTNGTAKIIGQSKYALVSSTIDGNAYLLDAQADFFVVFNKDGDIYHTNEAFLYNLIETRYDVLFSSKYDVYRIYLDGGKVGYFWVNTGKYKFIPKSKKDKHVKVDKSFKDMKP